MNETKSEKNERSTVARPPELSFRLPSLGEIGTTLLGWSSDEIQKQLSLSTEILLITANDHEFVACYSYMKNVKPTHSDSLGRVYFGNFGDDNNVRVALIVSSRQGPTSAVIAVKNAAEILHPKVILFVGICATMKPEKAKLGDVVISAKLATYADKKVRKDGSVEYRGSKEDVSRNMGQLILSAAHGWKPPLNDPNSLTVQVHRDAVMLSGPELVNNLERRQELGNSFQDALGLEMEGAGLYAAARDIGVEWGVIKAVSDFGDGSKTATEEWQPFASVMAISVVRNMFQYEDVIKNWPHYKDKELSEADGKPGGSNSCTDGAQSLEGTANGDVSRVHKVAGTSMSPTEQKSLLCGKCEKKRVSQLPDDRNYWPIYKMEIGCLEKIYKLLDLDDRSAESLMVALGGFSVNDADLIKKECMPSGCGIAKKALDKWGTSNTKNNVGALKKILEKTMKRMDVVEEIEYWKELHVCHGCGVKLN